MCVFNFGVPLREHVTGSFRLLAAVFKLYFVQLFQMTKDIQPAFCTNLFITMSLESEEHVLLDQTTTVCAV